MFRPLWSSTVRMYRCVVLYSTYVPICGPIQYACANLWPYTVRMCRCVVLYTTYVPMCRTYLLSLLTHHMIFTICLWQKQNSIYYFLYHDTTPYYNIEFMYGPIHFGPLFMCRCLLCTYGVLYSTYVPMWGLIQYVCVDVWFYTVRMCRCGVLYTVVLYLCANVYYVRIGSYTVRMCRCGVLYNVVLYLCADVNYTNTRRYLHNTLILDKRRLYV